MDLAHPLLIVVGAGGVGKTTLAAALGVHAAEAGRNTLVMTFDPSLRLKDALGVGDAARDHETEVPLGAPGRLAASLLDARRTFDRLIERYAPDRTARDRILANRFYQHLSGSLAGILEYMAVERLFEVAEEGRWDQVVLDTPPTRQALDFLEAPNRIVDFLDSGALKIALRSWFDRQGRFQPTSRLGRLGRGVEGLLDNVVGLDLLRDMGEFFQAFGPLFDGFRERAEKVKALLRATSTRFVLVAGPGEERLPDALFFARKLGEAGYRLGPIVVNQIHPRAALGATADGFDPATCRVDGRRLLSWLGERDARGRVALEALLPSSQTVLWVPLQAREPTDLAALSALGELLAGERDGVPEGLDATRHEVAAESSSGAPEES